MKKMILVVLVLALTFPVIAQQYKAQDEAYWFRYEVKDWWMLRQAEYKSNVWDSVTSNRNDYWSEAFRSYDYQSVICRVIKDSVRGYFEYWAGVDTNRSTMVFGRTLEWDKAAALDSTYVSSTGYWNCNITEKPIPVHPWARLKFIPGASGGRAVNDDSLFALYVTGRK